jgi:hypothetical protein
VVASLARSLIRLIEIRFRIFALQFDELSILHFYQLSIIQFDELDFSLLTKLPLIILPPTKLTEH